MVDEFCNLFKLQEREIKNSDEIIYTIVLYSIVLGEKRERNSESNMKKGEV